MTVPELLQKARFAHRKYRDMAGRITSTGTVATHPDLWQCGAAAREALSLRAEARAIDPQKTDDAWRGDAQAMRVSDDALVDFYVRYLGRDA